MENSFNVLFTEKYLVLADLQIKNRCNGSVSYWPGEIHYPTRDRVIDSFVKGFHQHTFITVTEQIICFLNGV